MKRQIIVLTVAALLIIGTLQVAFAAGWGAGGIGGRMGKGLGADGDFIPPVEELDLSADQRQQMVDICESYFKELQALRAKFQEKLHELRILRLKGETDESVLSEKAEEVKALQSEILKLMQEKRDKINSILTEEQKEQLYSRRGMRFGGGRGNMEPGLGIENNTSGSEAL